mmetsp:Transcript_12616/g.21586  ORF Transcript_12616/g.21586 Transcript_12616/m.21586 type:complete len:823 (-) Transcript_12616:75-2543(-)
MRGVGLFRSQTFQTAFVGPMRGVENNTNSDFKGRGRGRGNFSPDSIFSKKNESSNSKIDEELSNIIASWTDKPTKPEPVQSSDTNEDKADFSKILSDIINKKPATISDPGNDLHDDFGVGSGGSGDPPNDDILGDDITPEDAEPEFVHSSHPKHLDLPISIHQFVKQLNSKESKALLGKIVGYSSPPNVEFVVSDNVPDPILPNIVDTSVEETQLPDVDPRTVIAYYERLKYSGTDEETANLMTLRDHLFSHKKDPESDEQANVFDKGIQHTQYIIDHNVKNIIGYQQEKGLEDGKSLRDFTLNPSDVYFQHQEELEPICERIIKNKCDNDPEFKSKHEKFIEITKSLEDELKFAEEKHGYDHEIPLEISDKLHLIYKAHAKLLQLKDYENEDIPVYKDISSIPLHNDYVGEDGEKRMIEDFNNQSFKFLDMDSSIMKLPNALNSYLEGFVQGILPDDDFDVDSFHTERIGSHHFEVHRKFMKDVIEGQKWEEIGGSVTMKLPQDVRGFLLTQAVVTEYQIQTNTFRQDLENFIVTKLTKELRLLKEDTEEFYEVAQKLDHIREKRRKANIKRVHVMERSKQRAIDAGTYKEPTPSIITLALSRKGIVEEEDVLDQALEYLRRDGKKFTHRDIPSIRQENFREKFRAIFFNGSLKPHDKAKMVATTISNFIVSADELKIAAGAYQIMSPEPTEFEKQEKEMEQSQGDMAINLDFTSVTVDKAKQKARLLAKREGEASWEGYNTSDFEESEEEDNQIPEEFNELSKFKPHAKQQASWASVVDTPFETTGSLDSQFIAKEGEEEVIEDSDSADWNITDDEDSDI